MTRLYPLLLILFCSCGSHLNYLGSSYTPTRNVDVYVDATAIKRSYTIIGKGYMEYGFGPYTKNRIEEMQRKAIETAKAKGANAILFQDYFFKEISTNIQTTSLPDSAGKNLILTGNINPSISSRTDILFLKYD